ncbi:MAG: extracellular solute-binding protein [Nitrospinae bacterium]|nr:extracellular solute-binding protein [Nitrospinota bacterium]
MIKKVISGLLISLLIGLFLISACKRRTEEKKVINIVGSTTILPVATKGAEEFKKIHPRVDILISGGGSGVGVRYMATNMADIGMVSRHISKEEKENFPDVDFNVIPIGRDAVTCVISSEIYNAGVKILSLNDIRSIYSGEVTNWQGIGGPDKDILVIDKESHRGTRHVFMEVIFGDPMAIAKGAKIVTGSNNEEQTAIAQSDCAIGMLSNAWMNEDVKGVGIKMEDGNIIEPTLENVKKGTYPIARDLTFVTNGKPTGIVKEFIDFMVGPEGQKIVSEEYVPII